ncbi:ferrous iron transport protein A [Pasteurellaceae bacterium TAE3-ERU1]|uniref:FeoA family protein n=1 Tax=Spirabiliibacterium mucosae TaxID=28156 RepID=UPI001AACF3FB|nr:FeoA family protein [Spirabiliibacterium mucosae]MBE2897998.1 ferrous iron transport protein A [Spirabiliibacterium mucosae]MBV7388770.1 ferrous iron transport protein A [Pasteurellaceae bacterium TAE3-ERU1]
MESISLLALPKGQCATIVAVEDNHEFGALDATVSQRLLDLGFCPQTAITVIAHGLLGSPLAVRLGNGSQFSLRAQEAAKIRCQVREGA